MFLSEQSHLTIIKAVKNALEGYLLDVNKAFVTDIYLQPILSTGELVIFNDEDEELSRVAVQDWLNCNPEEFYTTVDSLLRGILEGMREEGSFSKLNIMKPYSFVLVDEDKETIVELLLIDDQDTMLLFDDLLKGLDEELNAFLKDLLEK